MTMDWRELRELAEYEPREGPVVSLFLNLSDPGRVETELNSLIRNASRERDKDGRFDESQRKALERLLREVDRGVRKELFPDAPGRLLVVFADNQGLWREYRLPVSLPSRMVIQQSPHVRPLSLLLDEFPRYGVLVADSRNAHLFSLYLGDFEEYPDVLIQDEVPDQVSAKKSMTVSSAGVYSGMGDQRIQRHIEDHVHRHYKHVAKRCFEVFKREGLDRLIVAAPDEGEISRLKDHLHSDLQRRWVGTFQARPGDDAQELKKRALDTSQRCEKKEERELLDRLVDAHLSGGLGVLGLEPVLTALRMGQVHTLIMRHDFTVPGYLCREDRYLSAGPASCPVCGKDLEPVERLSEEIVQEALSQDAEIEHVTVDHEGFDPYGLGAWLRFRV